MLRVICPPISLSSFPTGQFWNRLQDPAASCWAAGTENPAGYATAQSENPM